MRSIRPVKETAMVTGQGGFGLDVRPFDRKTKEAKEKVRHRPLSYEDLERLVSRLVLDD